MDRTNKVHGLAKLIMIVSDDSWTERAALEQARMYFDGVRDGRIADTTFQAVILAKEIGSYE
jgi:hypothetical protein